VVLNHNLHLNPNHRLSCFDRPGAGIKKPTAVASRGFLSKFNLPTTSTLGSAEYDDYQQVYLSNVH
jgi:hypothetical protein